MTRLEEIESRLSAIATELDAEGADIDALETEVRSLKDEKKQIEEAMRKREELRSAVASGKTGEVVRGFVDKMAKGEPGGAESKEYRNAFLKHLLEMDMTKEERAAFVHTTANTTAPLPTTMLNQIWDLVSGQHVIMGDITVYRTGTILEVVKHTAIAQGKAAKKAENTANDDEQNTFVKVTLSGNDFTKHVDISYAMARMSLDALEQYLVNEIALSLGEAMADDVVTTIGSGINAANKITTATANTITFAEIAKAFGLLKRVGAVCVYATRATIYNNLVAMVDTTGRPIFQPSMQAGQEGTLLGGTIKVEDSVGDGKLLIGDPKKVVYNMVQDIMIEQDKDIKKHVYTYSGYARGEGALIDDLAFVELTVKSGT